MSSVGQSTPLTILLHFVFQKLRRDKVLILPTTKEMALKDCIATTPNMMAAAFSRDGIIKSFVSAGMIDHRTKTCPDLFALIDSFKIDWSVMKGGKQWIISRVPKILNQIFTHGEVPESWFEDNDFPLDKDHDGNVWRLCSNADHLTRSKVMYHHAVLSRKNEDIRICLHAKQSIENRLQVESNEYIELNKDCELKLTAMIALNTDVLSLSKEEVMQKATMTMFETLNAPLVQAFYRCRVQEDLKQKYLFQPKEHTKR